MKALTTYRNRIATQLANLTTGNGYSFTLATIVKALDDPELQATALFPRAYVWTQAADEIALEYNDISTLYRATGAPVQVDVWYHLTPDDVQSEVADSIAADVIQCVMSDTYWTTNNSTVQINPTGVRYNYLDIQGDVLLVETTFRLSFWFDRTNTSP